MTEFTNDNDGKAAAASTVEPDAHGQAALLLAESILHSLIEASVLTTTQALETVTTAQEVKVEVAMLTGESSARMRESLALLDNIAMSLKTAT